MECGVLTVLADAGDSKLACAQGVTKAVGSYSLAAEHTAVVGDCLRASEQFVEQVLDLWVFGGGCCHDVT